MVRLPTYRQSFFCGSDRRDGLGLTVFYDDGTVFTDVEIDNRFQGYMNVVHGGILFGILDLIMWYVILIEAKKLAMTRKTDMEFLKPVKCNTRYRAISRFERTEGRDIYASAWVEDGAGNCYAKVTGLFREAKDVPPSQMIERFDFSSASPEARQYFPVPQGT
jgi:acyl-coenzyme A thioesterase PaaI-like protein